MDFQKIKLYLIVDPEHCVHAPLDVARRALAAGVQTIQLRDKRLNEETRQLAREIAAACRERSAVFIMNDDPWLARETGALGVHLGPNDRAVADVKAEFPDLIVGRSCGSVEMVKQAIADGADYVGVGAIFEARTVKSDASAPRGLDIIRALANADLHRDVPVVAIGGITSANAPEVWEAGAHGVAVIRAICGVENVEEAVAAFVRAEDY